MLTVYMDESGFTGEDLLCPEQPIFVHVSTTLTDAECAALHEEHFTGTQGHELKHKNLSKRPSGQNRVAGLINSVRELKKCTVWACHKEFTLLTYLVDLWVEPAMRQDGIDLYKDGGNLGLCNMAYYCLRAFQGDQFLRGHLRRFQHMMISRTMKSYREFWRELYRDYDRTDKRTKDILVYFLGGEMKLGPSQLREIPRRALDPALTTVAETCGYWRKGTDAPITLVHDKSSSLAKDRWLWDLLASPDIEPRTIGIPGREAVYPLNVVQTRFQDSRTHLQLQICDLIAGATAMWCRQFIVLPTKKEYVKQLGNAGIESLRIGAIWPEFAVDPEKLGRKGWSGESVDFLTAQLEKLLTKPVRR